MIEFILRIISSLGLLLKPTIYLDGNNKDKLNLFLE